MTQMNDLSPDQFALVRKAIALIYGIARGPRWRVYLPHAIETLSLLNGYKAGRADARADRSAKAVATKTKAGGTVA